MKNYSYYEHTPIYTIKELLAFCAAKYGERIALKYSVRKQEKSVSFSEFKSQVEFFGTYLFSEGFRGKHIAVLGENSYEWILTHFAVTCGGNVIVPIDKELDTGGIAELLTDSDSCALVYSDTYADIAEELQAGLPDITYINMKNLSQCIEQGEHLCEDGYIEYVNMDIKQDNLATIVYTSGTTGKSKGVMLTHGNIATNTFSTCQNVLIEGDSVLLLPLHHTFGLVAGILCVLFYGYSVYINSSLKRVMDDFQKARPQHLSLVPLVVETLYKRIWMTAAQQKKDRALRMLIKVSDALRRVKIDCRKLFFKSVISAFGGNLETIISGGAPIEDKYIKDFDAFGITIINGYGITECSPVVATNRNLAIKTGTVGFPLSCNEVKIDCPDQDGNGEILVRGTNVMVGYYRDRESTETVFRDGWFRTGDLGRIDDSKYLYITGRIKNLIILANGENIPAEVIEQQIYTIPYVKEAICYGKDNAIVAEVYLDEEVFDAKERINDDIQAVNQRLPQMRNIGRVVIRNTEFPKTTTKKIKRNLGGQKYA